MTGSETGGPSKGARTNLESGTTTGGKSLSILTQNISRMARSFELKKIISSTEFFSRMQMMPLVRAFKADLQRIHQAIKSFVQVSDKLSLEPVMVRLTPPPLPGVTWHLKAKGQNR